MQAKDAFNNPPMTANVLCVAAGDAEGPLDVLLHVLSHRRWLKGVAVTPLWVGVPVLRLSHPVTTVRYDDTAEQAGSLGSVCVCVRDTDL